MKTTERLRSFAKVINVIVNGLFICSIIFGCMCFMCFLSINGTNLVLLIAELVSKFEIEIKSEWIALAYSSCFSGLMSCLSSAIVLGYARKYTGKLVKDGTPFTIDGSKQLMKLGIITCAVPLATKIGSEIIRATVNFFIQNEVSPLETLDINFSTGIFLIILSFVCRSAAELIYGNRVQNQSTEYYQ